MHSWSRTGKIQTFECAGLAPVVDIGEVGARPVGITAGQPLVRSERLTLVVVVARRAVRPAEGAAGPRQQELEPGFLRVLRHLDRGEAAVQGVPNLVAIVLAESTRLCGTFEIRL